MERKCPRVVSNQTSYKKTISDVEGLLGQSSEPVEGLQDRIRILLEEFTKISEHEVCSFEDCTA